ncbi:quinone-dependent dihydroorotate dehydrogenase [Legionella hackeliae]|uniref:Dihydroorotate dehydrogenase (quinone) n=1 Tax=Legionella hackeliae TaxID=449 RepID=A0A0A8USW1_LEGHA|nr:quinone-dependent dihydroorotate dehydrogenase [Legionella hackeliae]KTD10375.1 dihydroorotate oxidase [Legionella hackeliae]CEK09874.1 Dihydroorotate dehydrogenase [Legionella hackeliae]STX49784.1 dihydroorotate oxidase [Legionella hackeliae]
MYSLIRPFLFRMDTEKAHQLTLSLLDWLPAFCFKKEQGQPIEALGLTFPHAIGLAAGLDKNGDHLHALSKLGFSFIEIGTITPRPQTGNPKPRLFRLPKAQALINRMGFNNQGVDVLVANVKKANYKGILGVNIGKNKETPLTRAGEDYVHCLRKVYPYASYVTINISSPNTPDLRLLQQDKFLGQLLDQLVEEQKRLADEYQRLVPLVVKLSPDESDETLKHMADVILQKKIAGIIATNTTCAREAVSHFPHGDEQGGLSGSPLAKRSTKCLQLLKEIVGKEVTLIGVGGIDRPEVAQNKIQAGASLLQIYTGLIYQGPQLISLLIKNLKES